MDQIKTFIRELKRYHFWVLCGVIVIASIVCWYMGVGSLSAEQQEFITSIQSAYGNVSSVSTVAHHPNDETAEQLRLLIDKRKKEVREAWSVKFAQQTKQQETGKTVLEWPKDLGDDFIRKVNEENGFLPFEQQRYRTNEETGEPTKPNDIIDFYLRDRYRFHVKKELPKLAQMIGSVWVPDLMGASETGSETQFSRRNDTEDAATIVRWRVENQQNIQREHFDWSSGESKTPTHLDIMYAQEDLWVLQALMKIIQNTNGNATVRHNAAIKEIFAIQIGKAAADERRGEIWRPTDNQAGDDTGGMDETSMAPADEFAEDGAAPTLVDPADNRYVDDNYDPISAEDLLNGNHVAKRMPVRMILNMDQRKIPKLLVECANSDLTVVVTQLRINPPVEDESRIFSTTRSSHSGFNPSQTNQTNLSWVTSPYPYDVRVEVYGIIYIFNAVNDELLEIEE